MKFKNNAKGYGILSVLFHWLFALCIIALLASGAYMVTLTYYHPWYHPLPYYHKIVGVFAFFLWIGRSLWHFCQPQPEITAQHFWEILAAKITHYTMLLLSGIVIISGYIIISTDTDFYNWFGVQLPTVQLDMEHQADLAGFWHKYIAYGLTGFISLHVLATLKHQFIDKRKLLQKIFGFKQ